MATNLFKTGGGGLWSSTLSWSLGAIPTASDGNVATFDATSPNCTIGSAAVCNSLNTTGYTNTITRTSTLAISGSITIGTGTLFSGTGVWTMNGSGTITTNGVALGALTITGALAITLAAALSLGSSTFTMSATGSITYTGAFNISCGACAISIPNGGTHTFSGNINASGLITLSPANAPNTGTMNGGIITGSAGLTLLSGTATSILTGTTSIVITGGTILVNSATTGQFRLPLTYSNVTFSSTNPIRYNTGTLTDAGGTNVATGTQLTIEASTTINTPNTTWNNVTLSGTPTITNNGALTVAGTLAASSGVVFAGTTGLTAGIFSCSTAGATFTFANGLTYILGTAGACTIAGTAASKITMQNTSGSTKAIVKFSQGFVHLLSFINALLLDSTTGLTAWCWGIGTNTSLNWGNLTAAVAQNAYGSCN